MGTDATYAKDTQITIEKSRQEIENTLKRYGCQEFVYGWGLNGASIGFKYKGLTVCIKVPYPTPAEVAKTDSGKMRNRGWIMQAQERLFKQRYRILAKEIHLKLEAVEAGTKLAEEAFLSDIVLPAGGTIGDKILPVIQNVLETGKIPSLLPGEK